MKKLYLKDIVKIVINNIFILFIVLIIKNQNAYAYWYEEVPIYETENIDSKWWLSRKQKEAEREKQRLELNKRMEENKNKEFRDKNIKWIYDSLDITNFPKDKWEIIDEDGDGIGYKYYFDKEGYLLIDTITPDYKIVDNKGREVDYNLRSINYDMDKEIPDSGIAIEEVQVYSPKANESSNIILGEGVVLKEKKKIFDNTISKDVVAYVSSSNRFIKETKGTIYNEIRWKKCSSLKGNGGYVVFDNPKNNFNKVTGYIATEYYTYNDNTLCTLKVYDADLYDKYEKEHHLYDIEEIYKKYNFNDTDDIRFSFIFDRSIKRLRFEIETEGEYKNRTCYLKDMKYGFSKTAFYEELIRKKEVEEEIEELKRLGIYVEDMWSFDLLDEDGENIEDYEEETENENNDDRIGGISYISDEETINYEDVIRDRNTGPAFDENLKNIKEVGPLQN